MHMQICIHTYMRCQHIVLKILRGHACTAIEIGTCAVNDMRTVSYSVEREMTVGKRKKVIVVVAQSIKMKEIGAILSHVQEGEE